VECVRRESFNGSLKECEKNKAWIIWRWEHGIIYFIESSCEKSCVSFPMFNAFNYNLVVQTRYGYGINLGDVKLRHF